MMTPPHGYDGIMRVFGDPRTANWEVENLVLVKFPHPLRLSFAQNQVATRARVHRLLKPNFEAAFADIEYAGLWDELKFYGGTYNVRPIAGTGKLSTHAWAIAIDVDVLGNPPGAKPAICPGIVRAFTRHGFTWGGNFSRPDGMHFQFCVNY